MTFLALIVELLIYAINIALIGFLSNKLYFSGAICKSKTRLDGKVAIITGANTGIGYETALDFAKRGARVILACRDTKKAEMAAKAIMNAANNNRVEVEYLDLADLETVRAFAAKMNKTLSRLDLLINNAGMMQCPYWQTKQGFEMQFGVNHLGHFLLTNLLLDLIKKAQSSRVVTVSSIAHMGGKIDWDNLNSEKGYSAIKAYNNSKLANILFTKELAERLKNTSSIAVSLHPGVVRTEIMRYTGEGIGLSLNFAVKFIYPFWCLFTKSCYEGAQTTIYCAVDEQVLQYNGCYFSDCRLKTPTSAARNAESARKLWQISEKLVNL